MKLKVWSEEEAKNSSDDQLFLKLEMCDHNRDIILGVFNKSGTKIESGNLLSIDNAFKVIIMIEGLNEIVPLKTDVTDTVLYYTRDEMSNICNSKIKDFFIKRIKDSSDESDTNDQIKH